MYNCSDVLHIRPQLRSSAVLFSWKTLRVIDIITNDYSPGYFLFRCVVPVYCTVHAGSLSSLPGKPNKIGFSCMLFRHTGAFSFLDITMPVVTKVNSRSSSFLSSQKTSVILKAAQIH